MDLDIDSLYRRYGPMVLRRCRRLLKDEELAVDVMHDVFVQLLRYGDRHGGQKSAAYLSTIATNLCLNRIRSRHRHREVPANESERGELQLLRTLSNDPEATAIHRSVLNRIFGTEPPSTATIAVYHLVDGMTLQEVAREVGLSVSGVRKRLRTLKARVAALEDLQ